MIKPCLGDGLWILWIWQKATPQGVEASKDWGFSSFAVPKVIQMAANGGNPETWTDRAKQCPILVNQLVQ
jgi:hypothetical protein